MPDERSVVHSEPKCVCQTHQGKEMLNMVVNLSVNYLWECLFGDSEYCRKSWQNRKALKVSNWQQNSEMLSRRLEYWIDVGTLGKINNIENQVRIIPN